jgi:hypothetical protein
VQRHGGVLQPTELQVLCGEAPQRLVGNEMTAAVGQAADQGGDVDGEDVLAPQPAPDIRELLGRRDGLRSRGDVGRVERPGRRADERVRGDAALVEGAQHAGLHRAEAGAAGQDEGGARLRRDALGADRGREGLGHGLGLQRRRERRGQDSGRAL